MPTQGEKAPGNIPESPEDLRKEIDRLLGDITVKLLGDEQKQQTMHSIAGTVMANWSAGNPFKKFISFLALKTLPAFPSGGESDASADIAADLGRLMMLRWMLQAHENRENPTAAGKRLTGFVKAFLENTDVSEWKNMLESSKASKIETARQFNETLTRYQGKLLVIMATLPTIISIVASSLKSYFQSQLELMAPEMAFEVFSGLNEQIVWKEVGQMLNDHYELARRNHIGDSLGGDGVKSALQNLAGDALKGIVSEIDPQRYAEAMDGKAQNKENLKNAVSDMMHAFPDFAKKMIAAAALSRNARMRGMKNRLLVLANMTEQDRKDTVNEFLEAFDAFELADLLSLVIEVFNTVYAGNPGCIPQTVSTLAASINTDEIRILAESDFIRDILKALKPLSTILMPTVIHAICDLLTPDSKETDDELQAALTRLSGILGGINVEQ